MQVLGEGQPFSEPLRTVGARVRSDVEMLTKMCVQRLIRVERFAAFIAHDGHRRFLVVGDVRVQIGAIVEPGLAHLASIGVSVLLHIFAVLRRLVILQVELIRVHLNESETPKTYKN